MPTLSERRAELVEAHRLLRRAAAALDRLAAAEEWPVPFSPVRYLVLGHLHDATQIGLTPRRLAWLLSMRRSSLAHHLDVLEQAEMLDRRRPSVGDERRVRVRPTELGGEAFRRLGALELPGTCPPGPSGP